MSLRWIPLLMLAAGAALGASSTAHAYNPDSWNGTYQVTCNSNVDPDDESTEPVPTDSYIELASFELTAPPSGELPATDISLGDDDPPMRLYLACDSDPETGSGLLTPSQASRNAFENKVAQFCTERLGDAVAFVDGLEWATLVYDPTDDCQDYATKFTDDVVSMLEDPIALVAKPMSEYTIDWNNVPWWSHHTAGTHYNTYVDATEGTHNRALNMWTGISVLHDNSKFAPVGPVCMGSTYGKDVRHYTKLGSHNEVDGHTKKGLAVGCYLPSTGAEFSFSLELHHGYSATTAP